MNIIYRKCFNYIMLITLGSLLVTSCADDDEIQYDSIERPIVTADAASYAAPEGSDLTITLTADKPYRASMQFKLEVMHADGTAMEEDDFVVNLDPAVFEIEGWGDDGYKVVFPAFVSSYSFTISMLNDDEIEADETFRLKLTPAGNMNGLVAPGSEYIDVTINSRGNDILSLVFDWDRTFDVSGTSYSLCELDYDMDFLVFADGEPMDAANPYDAAWTADCPEMLDINIMEYDQGIYHIYQNVYDNAGIAGAISPAFDIPVRVHYMRGGSQTLGEGGTYTQASEHAIDSDFESDPAGENLRYVVSVEIADDTFRLFDQSGTIASGRTAGSVKNAVKTALAPRAAKTSKNVRF